MEEVFLIVNKIEDHVVLRNLARLQKGGALQSEKLDLCSIFEEFLEEFFIIDVSNIIDLLFIDHVHISHLLGVDYLHLVVERQELFPIQCIVWQRGQLGDWEDLALFDFDLADVIDLIVFFVIEVLLDIDWLTETGDLEEVVFLVIRNQSVVQLVLLMLLPLRWMQRML